MRSGVCSERTTSALRTAESGCGAWPTATVSSGAQTAENPYPNQTGGTTLTDAAVRQWPTASAQSYGYNQGGSAGRVSPARPSLDALARGWATPNAHDAATPKTPEQIARMRSSAASRTTPGSAPGVSNLNEQAATWGTPTSHERTFEPRQVDHGQQIANQVRDWPTPRSSANENRTTKPAPTHGTTHGRVLAGEACGLPARQTCAHGGTCKPTLNPRFVEWLMGFPIGWTDFAPLETAWSLWLRRARSEFSRLGSPSEWIWM